eukprot:3987884-Amphidinium_carterae.1
MVVLASEPSVPMFCGVVTLNMLALQHSQRSTTTTSQCGCFGLPQVKVQVDTTSMLVAELPGSAQMPEKLPPDDVQISKSMSKLSLHCQRQHVTVLTMTFSSLVSCFQFCPRGRFATNLFTIHSGS